MKESRVKWYISAYVECPNCGRDNDFTDIDEWWVYSEPGENIDEFFQPAIIKCDKCLEEFKVTGSDY